MAEDEVARGSKPLKIKKMYVLGALLVEQHQEQSKMTSRNKMKKASEVWREQNKKGKGVGAGVGWLCYEINNRDSLWIECCYK